MELYKCCTLCPRRCGVDRTAGETGFCGESDCVRISRAALHFWEEPCISGEKGSGAVFFSGCNLRCCYCQNRQISSGKVGKEVSAERLCEIFFELEGQGAHNINLVTPTHFIPQIVSAVRLAKNAGLCLPFVYNCGGYESVEGLKLLEGLIDIYLPDFKYYDERYAVKYSGAPNYKEIAAAAVTEMLRQVGPAQFDENGMMKKGVIVRHLALPGLLDDSKRILKFLNRTFSDDIYISIMSQFTPQEGCDEYSELSRPLDREDYDELIEYAEAIGIVNGFTQEEGCADESFIPPFDLTGV